MRQDSIRFETLNFRAPVATNSGGALSGAADDQHDCDNDDNDRGTTAGALAVSV
jgi:hypothetical protein